MVQSQPLCFYSVLILSTHMELTQNYNSLHHKAKPIKFSMSKPSPIVLQWWLKKDAWALHNMHVIKILYPVT
jgi:hypothetical protein